MILQPIYIKIKTPRVPNFLISEDGDSFPVGNMNDDDLRHLAKKWTKNLIENAHRQRKNKKINK
jgi:hypothetical protein